MHHDWSETTVQLVFEVTLNVVDPAGDAGTSWFDGVTESEGSAASCVTVTTTGGIPDTVTVILATRLYSEVFSV